MEIDLGDDAPKSGPLYLIARGSIHDTELLLNVAITQGERCKAHGSNFARGAEGRAVGPLRNQIWGFPRVARKQFFLI